jgi:hypothetical protein
METKAKAKKIKLRIVKNKDLAVLKEKVDQIKKKRLNCDIT